MRRLMLISLLLFGTLVHAQTTVQGKVVDGNGLPIPGANVLLVGQAQGTVTDFDGNFTFNTNQQPPFDLRISSIGYSEVTLRVTQNNQTLSVILPEASTI